jgi:hypothetical protein
MLTVISLSKELTFVSEATASFLRRPYLYRSRKCHALGGITGRDGCRNVQVKGLLKFFLGK